MDSGALMIGERLKRARAAAGLSMRALAEKADVSANMIKKYEHDQSMPGSRVLIALAKALNVRSEYFFRSVEVRLEGVEYRKRASTPAGLLKRIEADILDQAERWQELANLWPSFPVPSFEMPSELPESVASLEQVDALACLVRSVWRLGINPIPDLISELESKGILVILSDVDDLSKFDGLQASVANAPLIVVSAHWPGDRQRFTLAHELGHLLLHGRLRPELDEEKACNRFACAFLLPDSGLFEHLGERRHHLEPQELYMLKHEYGLSMAACLRRAYDLAVISDAYYKKTQIFFGKNGWRKKEPGDPYPQERTTLFPQLVYRALGEEIIGESKAAELLNMPLSRFHRERQMELIGESADQ